MVREMENRSFAPQRSAAEEELDEAKKLLEFIKSNCTKQYEQNQQAAKKIGELLKDFEAKLKELEEALKEARDMVQKANSQNTLNSQALTDLLKRIKNLEKERDNVAKDIVIATRQLKDTDNLLKKLSDSKKEYEQLAAQLDGAKTDLSDRVNDISRAAGMEGLVKRAEDHAALLDRLARELQEAIRNSSGRGDVKDALAAVDAYKNITEAVNAAEEAARKAKEAADKAQKDVSQGDIPNRSKNLKDKSNRLLKDAKNAAKDLKQVTEDLTNQQERLEAAGKKKATLEKKLLTITDGLKGVQRDDIGTMIDAAKRKAAAANASATDTLDKLRSIGDEVKKISLTPSGSNIDRMLDDVDMTVKNLSNSIPSLLDKITQVESLSSQIDPNNNISSNINRIKELIEQARDAANRISIPMKFTGSEYVELRPPKNLADVRAYTAFNLLLQRPKGTSRGDGRRRRQQTARDAGDLFVLYLGNSDTSKDYLGMALRSNVLYFIYKLNGNVYEIKSDTITDSDPEPAFFDKVDVYRIYQDAEVNLTKLFTSNKPDEPLTNTKQGEPNYNLLDLDPSEVVFYVGGYPDDFTPPDPLKYPKYRGCIELSTFNERFISLYNFKSLKPDNVTLQVPCKRYVQPTVSEYFEGSGYAKVPLDKVSRVLSLAQAMETRAENAVLLYIGDENSYYSITLEKGYMVLRGRDGDNVLEPRKSEKKQDVNGELKVIFDSANQIVRVRMKNTEVLTGPYSQGNFKSYYIGGVPSDLRERDNITAVPLKGCVFSVNAAGRTPTIAEKVGVSRGCPKEMLTSRKAEFCTGGSLEAPPKDFDLAGDVTLSLGFKSTENEGLLLQNKQAGRDLGLRMVNGSVMLQIQDTVWKSNKQYQDGEWHYLTVIKRGQSVELRVDEQDVGEIQDSMPQTINSDNIVLGNGDFTGCLANVYLRRPRIQWRAEDLSLFTSTGDILLDVCTVTPPPQSMLARHGSSRSQKDSRGTLKREGAAACFLPTALGHSFQLAGTPSSATFRAPPAAISSRPFFSLDVRTRSAEGLLLYSPSEQEEFHLALYVSKGRIRLSVGRRREIFNREKYNDGKWHTVTLSLEKRRFRLVIDGLRAQDGLLEAGESSSLQLSSTVYLGTPPTSTQADLKWKVLPEHGVVGCVRNFKMNGMPAAAPLMNHGVGPCFEGHAESGAYFSGQGAYVIADDSLVLGQQSFELVFEVRPSTETGLLLHVGDAHHVTVFMRQGEVVAQVNKGGGEFSVAVRPKHPLCDGVFHRIAVIQSSNVVEMHVDTEGMYTIGLSSTSPPKATYPVYVGGVPDHLNFSSLPVSESYVGCLQNVLINGAAVILEKLSRVFGPVSLRDCPSNLRRSRPSREA
uniref:Laminin G domain-containing protein n=2 Tax=Electrophorus electricus TaxID=8005 RepID=A0A4W4GXF5_ELEEL